MRALPQLRPVPVLGAIGSGALALGRSLPDSPLLDRLLRGRAWIGLIGGLLIGLVALNVSLLKLNTVTGRNAEKAEALEIKNSQLRAKVSRLASPDRLQHAGRELGMAMSVAARVRYVSARPGDARRAARALRSGVLSSFAFAPLPPAPTAPAPSLAQTAQPTAPQTATPASAPSPAPTPVQGPQQLGAAAPVQGLVGAQVGTGGETSPASGG